MKGIPCLDLHGYELEKENIKIIVIDFINTSFKLDYKKINIIYGDSSNKFKNMLKEILMDQYHRGLVKGFTIHPNHVDVSLNIKKVFFHSYEFRKNLDDKISENISKFFELKLLTAIFDFSDFINDENDKVRYKNVIINVLSNYSRLIDFNFDDDTYKVVVSLKANELVIDSVVKRIDVRYFFGLFRYNIDFKDKNVFIIHAPNGCGKTNLLNTIDDIFGNKKKFFSKSEMNCLKHDVKNNLDIEIKLKKILFDNISITIQNNNSDNDFIVCRNENLGDKVFIKNVNLFYALLGYVDLFGIECIYLKKLQEENKINILDNIFSVDNLYNKDDVIRRKVLRFNKIMNTFFCFEKSVELKIDELINNKKNSVENLLDIRYKERNEKNIPDVFEYDQKIDFDMLSTGEKNIIRIFLRLIFETKYGSLVLLDEPEISLHIEWQSLLIKNIVKLAEEYNLRVLIATHSPYIVDNPNVIVGRVENE